MPDYTMET